MTISVFVAESVRARAAGRCEYCCMHQSLQAATFHIEHVRLLALGGQSSIENLALACPSCNLHKADRVSAIDPSRFDAASAYVAVKRPLLDDMAPYIFRTHDFGATWTTITTGLPAGDYVHVVREDPVRRGMLYAGTQHGVYLSFDDGAHWQPLSLTLPDVPVVDLIVVRNDVVIATHGRGFYILDNVGPLRQQ